MANIDSIMTIVMVATTGIGGWYGGKRSGRGGTLGEAASAVTILTGEVESLKRAITTKDNELAEMRGRITTLEDLVTQRADVDGVRRVVDRIAEKVGA